jgi:hypothetical protein
MAQSSLARSAQESPQLAKCFRHEGEEVEPSRFEPQPPLCKDTAPRKYVEDSSQSQPRFLVVAAAPSGVASVPDYRYAPATIASSESAQRSR